MRLVVLVSPGPSAQFQFPVSFWFGGGYGKGSLPIPPELEKLRGMPILCIYGDKEAGSLCPKLRDLVTPLKMGGGHHFGGDYDEIGQEILRRLAAPDPEPAKK